MNDEGENLVPVYLCGTDAAYHIPGDFHGVTVYFDEKSLRQNRSCVNAGCGIVKVYLDCRDPFIVQKEDWEKMKACAVPIEVIAKRDLIKSYKAIFTSIAKAFSATKRYFGWSRKARRNIKVFPKVTRHIK